MDNDAIDDLFKILEVAFTAVEQKVQLGYVSKLNSWFAGWLRKHADLDISSKELVRVFTEKELPRKLTGAILYEVAVKDFMGTFRAEKEVREKSYPIVFAAGEILGLSGPELEARVSEIVRRDTTPSVEKSVDEAWEKLLERGGSMGMNEASHFIGIIGADALRGSGLSVMQLAGDFPDIARSKRELEGKKILDLVRSFSITPGLRGDKALLLSLRESLQKMKEELCSSKSSA